jgi:UDP-N-acetylglucosamine 1-carboxyvinyltransferase
VKKINKLLKVIGPQKPQGKVKVSGAKNSATRLLAASLLTSEPVRISNFPTQLVDAKVKMKFIRGLGVTIKVDETHEELEIIAKNVSHRSISYDLPIRTTYLLAGGQLVRNNIAHIPYPGGCKIGARNYDLHIMIWEQLGCKVTEKESYIEIVGELKGGRVDFPISTVGGTENALICASVANGNTEIHNAYITPEVQDLIYFLIKMGAKIKTFGNSMIMIEGAAGQLRGVSYEVMLDRIEALTWIIFAAITGGSIKVEGVPFEHLEIPLLHLKDSGIDIFRNSNTALMSPDCINGEYIQPFELACGTHPGVISDMQPFYTLLGMKAQGKSRIFDYRYPERILYASELNKFSPGSVASEKGKITTNGLARLKAAQVKSTDLRGSMALIMTVFCAEGESVVTDIEMAMRGYNKLDEKMANLGLKFEIIKG